jgi:hypothetical protein
MRWARPLAPRDDRIPLPGIGLLPFDLDSQCPSRHALNAKEVSIVSDFVLLYRSSDEAFQAATGSAERARQTMARWQRWFKDMTEKGQLKNLGQPLDRSLGKVVGGKRRTVTDGPYPEAKEVLGGFSIIEARDLNQAAQIASGCPILEFGGSVEVRPVMIFSGTTDAP